MQRGERRAQAGGADAPGAARGGQARSDGEREQEDPAWAHRRARVSGRPGGSSPTGVPEYDLLRNGQGRQARTRRGAEGCAPGGGARAGPRPRWCWAAAASPAASTRSAPCARWTCCRSTAPSTSSTSTSGRSAGSFVAALTANGVTPEEMMRVVNQQVPTPFRDIDLGQLLRPNLKEYVRKGVALPWKAVSVLRELAPQLGQVSVMDFALGLAEGLPSGVYSGVGPGVLHADGAERPRPHRRLPPAGARALPRGDRPRHLRADRLRRQRLGRRPDLDRRARVDRAADGLQAGPRPRPRADRRRHRLDDQPRHRRRGGREVHRGGQPAGALRQRLHRARRAGCWARGRGTSATWACRRSATRRSS